MALTNLASHKPVEESRPNLSGSSVALGSRIDVYPSSPLPEFNGIGGPAFAARLKSDAGSDLVAIICTSGLPARLDVVNSMRSIDHPGVMRLVESGVVTWPDGSRYPAFAYQRPLSPRFMHSLDETHTPLSEDALNRRFLHPLIGALSEFLRTGTTHGAISPLNIFWRYGGVAAPQLGDCMSAPSGIAQPTACATIERGMSMPIGRGIGTHADDCYALGITAAMMVMGHNPFKGMDDQAIVRAKMEHGTFNAVIGHHHLSPNHIELFRGLLSDDVHQRWTAADCEQWLAGRRLTPKSSDIGRRANRHFDFGGREYWHARQLASAFANNVTEAAKVIGSGALDRWLRRSMDDEDRADDVAEAASSLKDSGHTAHYEEQLVARVCIALDPPAPIRYRGLIFMPDGIAAMLAQAMLTNGNVEVLANVISSQVISFWVEMQKHLKTEMVPLSQQFDRITSMIEKTSYGNGVERALYELNPTLPCLSPMLRGQCVTSARALMPALEQVAASGNRPAEPMDRHIAAFLVVRERKGELLLESMSAPENSPRRGLAMLSLYGDLQNRYGPEKLSALARWLSPTLENATKRFFSKHLRDQVQKQIRDAVELGNLGTLARVVDSPQRTQRDTQEFVAARLLYLNILKEVNMLEGRLANKESVVQTIGKPFAATISSLVAMLAVLVAVGRAMWMMF